ncbi:hypothetical protein KO353_04450 [Elioraea tepida]|uniref:Uncharacterized protein n=1 Tax=Elioraea tepida TaxID=2843330 RepID=A0A975U388_9PROT|nr:hypothetical protein [Elioraea tepida]QXM25484.1 hypothetical protein KO353_04450 [Elioraea tepida]
MLPPFERLIREAAAALPRDATCDEIALWIIARRSNALRLILGAIARQTLRRHDDDPAWLRLARLERQR